MKRLILRVLRPALLVAVIVVAATPTCILPQDPELEVTKIIFGTGFDGTRVTGVPDPPPEFVEGIREVYYEVRFNEPLETGTLFKKTWECPVGGLCTESYIPKKCSNGAVERIVGELRYYDSLQDLDVGEYTLVSISMLDKDDKTWDEFNLLTIQRSFEVVASDSRR
jgi:hypothetical protein